MSNTAAKPDSFNPPQQAYLLLLTLFLIAPIASTGLLPIATAILQAAGLVLLVVILWSPTKLELPSHVIFAVSAILLLPILYLVPLPEVLSSSLPGRSLFAGSLADEEPGLGAGFLSVVPTETQAAWLTLLPALAVFLTASTLDDSQLYNSLKLILILAVAQSILALIQFGATKESALYLGMEHAHFGSGVGTYTNRNHLAGFLNMVIPITLSFLAKVIVDFNRALHGRDSLTARIDFFGSAKGVWGVALAGAFVLFVVAVIFSRSRAGIAISLLCIVSSMFMFAAGMLEKKKARTFMFLFLSAFSLALIIGIGPVLERFSANDPLTDGRWTIFSGSIQAIDRFLPIGAGPGTFDEIYPPHQEVIHGRYLINHAHNDYLEWVVETGMFGLALILLGLAAYVLQWKRVRPRGPWSGANFIQIGAGISVLSILIHSTVDYNLRTPANAVFFAFFAGVFYRKVKSRKPKPRKRSRTSASGKQSGLPLDRPGLKSTNDRESQVPNPFLEGG